MAEVFFYHLEHSPLEAALPRLLTLSLGRGWRVVVEVGSLERLEALDSHLWTFSDDSFLPHGVPRDGFQAEQPVFLTTGQETPNGANVRFYVDRAAPQSAEAVEGFERVVLMFDGRDPEALTAARRHWKALKDAGLSLKYFQQGDGGGWTLKSQVN